jgi:long-chain acyl-CoA synthetase
VNRPWFAHYDPGVPHSLAPYPGETFLDLFDALVREQPRHVFVWFKGRPISAAQTDALATAFAAALAARGLRRGDRLALLLPNCPQFLIATLGAWRAGLVVVPLNPLYTVEELQRPLASTGARGIVVLTPFYERVKRLQPRTALELVIPSSIKEFLPTHLRVLFTWFKEKKEGHRITPRGDDTPFPLLLRAHAGAERSRARVEIGDTAFVLLSGGTTGTPKGVVAPHGSLTIAARQLYAWYGGQLSPGRDVFLLPLPLFHVYGCVATLGCVLIGRQPLALVPNPRDLRDLIATIRRLKPAGFAGVPTLYNALVSQPEVAAGRVDFRSIKLCVSGAAPLPAETRARFEALTGSRLVEGYSMTEALIAGAVNPIGSGGKLGSVGLPLPDVDMRIVDAEEGMRPLPAGEPGELLIRAPQLMPGYWNDAAETRIALRDHGDGGGPWLHTGDIGYFDADGFLFLVDRKKDLIKSGGLQVWPRDIEEVLVSHPSISEAAVTAMPDAHKGEVPKAWLVLRSGARVDPEEIRAFCKERLAPFKVPVAIEFRKELPRSLAGKVLRRVLVEEDRQALAADPS